MTCSPSLSRIVFLFPWFPLNLPDFRTRVRQAADLLLSDTKSTFRINQMRKAMEMTSLAAVQVTLFEQQKEVLHI